MEKKTRLQTVLEMIQEGNSDEEIAEKLDLTFKRVKNIRKNLIKEGLLERPKTKKERVLEEYKKGKNYKEISEEFNITFANAREYRNIFIREGLLERPESELKKRHKNVVKKAVNEQIKEDIDVEKLNGSTEDFDGSITQEEKYKQKIALFKKKFYKVGSLPMRDLMQLAEIMELLEPDINRLKMFWNMCIKSGQTDLLMKYISKKDSDERLDEKQRKKVKQLQIKLKECIKIKEVRKLLRENKSVKEILSLTNLTEVEVIRIKNEMEDSINIGR